MGNLFDLASPSAKLGEELNAQQRAAVHHGEGPLLVVAGAGTGKTRVITERIRHLLETDPQLPGESILALTFTDRAAGEMKHRVIRTAGERGHRRLRGNISRLLQRAAAGTQSQAADARRRRSLDSACAAIFRCWRWSAIGGWRSRDNSWATS